MNSFSDIFATVFCFSSRFITQVCTILQKLKYEVDTHNIQLKTNENQCDLTAYKTGM